MSDFKVSSLDLAAAIWTATGIQPKVIPAGEGENLSAFGFPFTPEVRDTVLAFEDGLQLNARRLLAQRRLLYRILRGR